MASSCHIEIIVVEKDELVTKADDMKITPKCTSIQVARKRLLAASREMLAAGNEAVKRTFILRLV